MKWISLPALRKQTRDNLGLIVSVAAALFAGWAGYETRRTVDVQIVAMKKADITAQENERLQKETTELDERPYVNAIPVDPALYYMPDDHKMFFESKLRIITSGRTPALGVRLAFSCLESVDDELGKDPYISAYNKTIKLLTEKQAEPVPFAYLTTSGDLRSPVCDTEAYFAGARPIVILGSLDYSDYFKRQHHTSFCYVGAFKSTAAMDAIKRHSGMLKHYTLMFSYKMHDFECEPCSSYKATFD